LHLFNLVKEGKDFNKIRIDLSSNGFNEDEIKSIIRHIDECHLQSYLQSSKQKKLATIRIAGFILMAVSLPMLLYQFFILKRISFIILYFNLFAISGGLSMIWYSKNNQGLGVLKARRERRFMRRMH
jgi:hypothetical protein